MTTRKQDRPYPVFGKSFIDPAAMAQMDQAMKLPVSVKGALMPDAHVGYGLPIGGVLATYNSVIPYGVGMDIGCRMCMSVFPMGERTLQKERERYRELLVSHTRFGKAAFGDTGDHPILERREFYDIPFLRSLQPVAREQLGSSGGGNHFVDVGLLELQEKVDGVLLEPGRYVAILSHSGSRNMGA